MLYEIHMIKNYPPTNLNRDEMGAPKTCMFGGALRGRISSQCLKRSWRTSEIFREAVGEENLGMRTRQLPQLVTDALRARGVQEAYLTELMPKLSAFGNKKGTENQKGNYTAQLVFYAPQDIAAVADAVEQKLAECATLKEVKAIKGKKTDKKDSKWICDLFKHDLLKSSFIPPKDIRELRDLSVIVSSSSV